ncbi:MAG TPA: hypothetical protein PLZ51_22000, partial [Aggregatilineales bacterium]|nr:hypothetical protein [Aggregatilineales bacterium]
LRLVSIGATESLRPSPWGCLHHIMPQYPYYNSSPIDCPTRKIMNLIPTPPSKRRGCSIYRVL